MGANCCCGVRQKEAFCVSHQLSWQPVKSFECRRRLHAVQTKQEERDAGSPKAKVVAGFDEWDMKSDTAQPMTGKRNATTPRLKRNTKWISWQIFFERLLYCEPCLNEIGGSVLQLSHFEMRRFRLECQRSDCSFTQLPTRCIMRIRRTFLSESSGCIEQP